MPDFALSTLGFACDDKSYNDVRDLPFDRFSRLVLPDQRNVVEFIPVKNSHLEFVRRRLVIGGSAPVSVPLQSKTVKHKRYPLATNPNTKLDRVFSPQRWLHTAALKRDEYCIEHLEATALEWRIEERIIPA